VKNPIAQKIIKQQKHLVIGQNDNLQLLFQLNVKKVEHKICTPIQLRPLL